MIRLLKKILPDRPTPLTILRGPFRGAKVVMNPRASMRKVLGLYEHELNAWLEAALARVARVIDVGANDGYFTFGALAAFRRLGKRGEVIAFEPQGALVRTLRQNASAQGLAERLQVFESLVGGRVAEGMTTLDALAVSDRGATLIKIDVEGAELAALRGARATIAAAGPDLHLFVEMHPHLWTELGISAEDLRRECEAQKRVAERLDGGREELWQTEGVCLRLRPAGACLAVALAKAGA